MNTKNSVVAIYDEHDKAEAAVKELQKSGFTMKNLSIVVLSTAGASEAAVHQTDSASVGSH